MPKDRIVFFNLGPDYEKIFRSAFHSALKKIIKTIGPVKPFEVLVYYSPYDFEGNGKILFTDGRIVDTNSVVIGFNINNSSRKDLDAHKKSMESTFIHEFVHCIRWRHGEIGTLADMIVEEGVSCYFQVLLSIAPGYLDIENTDPEYIKKWWKWWYEKYYIKPFSKTEKYLQDEGFRQAIYRIGYFLIKSYVASHPQCGFDSLMRISRKEFLKFALKLFADPKSRQKGKVLNKGR